MIIAFYLAKILIKLIIISSNDVKKKICDSLYAINWADIKGNVLESKHIELYRQTKDTNKPILPLNMTKPRHEDTTEKRCCFKRK